MKGNGFPGEAAANILLNGISQIFVITNVWAGLLVLAGVAWVSVPMAALLAIGCVLGSLSARLYRDVPQEDIASGLAGYNGALIGAASFVTWGEFWPALATTVLGSFAGTVITTLVRTLLRRGPLPRFGLPVLTAPFCVTSGVVALLGVNYTTGAPLHHVQPGSAVMAAIDSILDNVAEVVLVDNIVTGACILLGLFLASRAVGLAATAGAIGEYLFDTFTQQDIDKLVHGLLGYSGVLVTIALGVVFVTGSLTRRVLAALIGLLLSQAIALGMTYTPVPAYTWPFVLPTWLVIGALAWHDARTRAADHDAQ